MFCEPSSARAVVWLGEGACAMLRRIAKHQMIDLWTSDRQAEAVR